MRELGEGRVWVRLSSDFMCVLLCLQAPRAGPSIYSTLGGKKMRVAQWLLLSALGPEAREQNPPYQEWVRANLDKGRWLGLSHVLFSILVSPFHCFFLLSSLIEFSERQKIKPENASRSPSDGVRKTRLRETVLIFQRVEPASSSPDGAEPDARLFRSLVSPSFFSSSWKKINVE